MICIKEFADFIDALTKSDDTFIDFQNAFDKIGKRYAITKVVCKLYVPPNPYTKVGEEREIDAYVLEGAICDDKPSHIKSVITGENGKATFELYRAVGANGFTQEEINDLEIVLNTVVFHAARFRMMNIIQEFKFIDGLTGLPNSGGVLTYIESLMEKRELEKYNAYYFDLSNFSLVNKRFGSREADKIIVRYVEAIRDFLLQGEIVGRIGGDNFVALVFKERTEQFLQFLSGVITYGVLREKELPVKISAIAGVLELDDSIDDSGSVLNDSAMALNMAKHVLKKPFVFASEELRSKGYNNKQVASSFMEALYTGEFHVYYQPKVSSQDYSLVGGEALSRWIKDGTMMQPAEFIPVIEENGMICMLDFYVLEQVCKDVKEWLECGMNVGRISVNLSRKHLSNPHLVEDIMDILRKYDMAGRHIEIELTETVDEVETNLLIEFIKRMKYHKVKVSIDDFGTGYSSLNMLRSFSVDVLKIDKSFIDNLDERNKIVLSNIICMAHDLDMEIVAEGVELKEQAEFLRSIGCHTLQGYLFDKPLAKEAYEAKLQRGTYEI